MNVWTREEILSNYVYWPIFGCFDDWMCKTLNLYVNNKEPFSQKESEYAALERVGDGKIGFIISFERKERKEGTGERN